MWGVLQPLLHISCHMLNRKTAGALCGAGLGGGTVVTAGKERNPSHMLLVFHPWRKNLMPLG